MVLKLQTCKSVPNPKYNLHWFNNRLSNVYVKFEVRVYNLVLNHSTLWINKVIVWYIIH